MAKGLISFIGIFILILFSAVTAIAGAVMMTTTLFTGNGQFIQGLEVFFLGSISFTATLIAYVSTKVLRNTDIIADALTDVLEDMDKKSSHPLANLFGGLGGHGGFPPPFPTSGTMRMARMDKEGNIIPMGEKDFNNPEEFLKFRDELINNAMNKSGKKPVNEMSMEELENEREAAEKKQDFELAAALRDAINEKKKKKE